MKEKKKKQQSTTSKKSSHNTLDWVERQLMEVRAFDMGISLEYQEINWTNYKKIIYVIIGL